MPTRSIHPVGDIETVLLAPLYATYYSCIEHPYGVLGYLGDDLGTDCTVEGGINGDDGFPREFRTNGATNEDWYGWHEPIHAPLDGTVERIWLNDRVNTPGTMGPPPAGEIVIRGDNGVMVFIGHTDAPLVKKGDRVVAGQVIARVGNNGVARATSQPHRRLPHLRHDASSDQMGSEGDGETSGKTEVSHSHGRFLRPSKLVKGSP